MTSEDNGWFLYEDLQLLFYEINKFLFFFSFLCSQVNISAARIEMKH